MGVSGDISWYPGPVNIPVFIPCNSYNVDEVNYTLSPRHNNRASNGVYCIMVCTVLGAQSSLVKQTYSAQVAKPRNIIRRNQYATIHLKHMLL